MKPLDHSVIEAGIGILLVEASRLLGAGKDAENFSNELGGLGGL